MGRLLIVEDDEGIRRFVRQTLEAAGHEVAEASTMRRGLADAGIGRPDLVILDLGLPDGEGIDLIREIRNWNTCPIIVISARLDDSDKIAALDVGADDYLVKPFSMHELLARVRAALRRASNVGTEKSAPIRFGECEFDLKQRVVRRLGERVHLTQVEFKLVAALVGHESQVFTHRQLLRVVWGPAASEHVHYLRIYMGRLRRKLEVDPARPVHFLTEVGVGYRFVANPESLSSRLLPG
jgi:two-component system KDP operon response regulator KdpE